MFDLAQLAPHAPYIVIEPIDANKTSSIVVADEYKDVPQRATVRVVWDPSLMYVPADTPQPLVAAGDVVFHAKYGAIEIADTPYALLHHEDIYCTITGAEKDDSKA